MVKKCPGRGAGSLFGRTHCRGASPAAMGALRQGQPHARTCLRQAGSAAAQTAVLQGGLLRLEQLGAEGFVQALGRLLVERDANVQPRLEVVARDVVVDVDGGQHGEVVAEDLEQDAVELFQPRVEDHALLGVGVARLEPRVQHELGHRAHAVDHEQDPQAVALLRDVALVPAQKRRVVPVDAKRPRELAHDAEPRDGKQADDEELAH
mmetsp:Transcript_5006/g.15972  ORF Transcript_5006/g.15972 Transcript_5006/m.15972 type:complete len:208 (-) Transcript_5006:477-1100(-)